MIFNSMDNGANLALTEEEKLLIQQSLGGMDTMPSSVGSPTTVSVFGDPSDWNALTGSSLTPATNFPTLPQGEDDVQRSAAYRDLEKLFREADAVEQWAPVRSDPASQGSVTRSINPEYLTQFGTQPLEEDTAVVRCDLCGKAVAKKFLASHKTRSCPNAPRSSTPVATTTTTTTSVAGIGSAVTPEAGKAANSTGTLGGEEVLSSGSVVALSGQAPTPAFNGKGKVKEGDGRGRPRTKKPGKPPGRKPQGGTAADEPACASEILGKRSLADTLQDDELNPETPTPADSSMPSPTPSSISTLAPSEKKARVKKERKSGGGSKAPASSAGSLAAAAAKANARGKGPIDLDKHCGVPLPNGQLCTRSLTCKTHSMGAKRAVAGRSQLYDMLLKAHLAKSRSAAAALKHASQKEKDSGEANETSGLTQQEEEEERAMSSDEEVDLVLRAIREYRPTPLATRTVTPLVRRRHRYLRIRDIFLDALKPPNGPQVLNQ